MAIDLETLAKRLQQARVGAGLTQEQVGNALGVPRTAIVQIEAGNRSVSTLELVQMASLYHRSVSDFFTETEPEEDALVALFRATEDFQQHPEIQGEIGRHVAICRAGVELERLLELPLRGGPPSYDLPYPTRTMEAVDQGVSVAEQERRRLRLGHTRIADMVKLVNDQGIWASGARLPDDMSGLFLRPRRSGCLFSSISDMCGLASGSPTHTNTRTRSLTDPERQRYRSPETARISAKCVPMPLRLLF